MMRKNKILAAVCSLIFAVSCAACGSAAQEIMWIGEGEGSLTGGQDGLSAGTAQPGPGNGAGSMPSAEQPQDSGGESPAQEICVYVCGAVESPGVVFLPCDSRAVDALEAAGGFTAEASREAVNLAARVADGEKLYFPTGEEYAEQTPEEEAEAAGLVNINTADAARLCTLPGIGEARAADIIAYRESHGGFKACEDIMQVPGIKESVYSKISGKITVK